MLPGIPGSASGSSDGAAPPGAARAPGGPARGAGRAAGRARVRAAALQEPAVCRGLLRVLEGVPGGVVVSSWVSVPSSS